MKETILSMHPCSALKRNSQAVIFSCGSAYHNGQTHILLRYPTYSNQREIMFAVLSEEFPNMCNINEREQLSSILNCKLNKSIRLCAKTCFKILKTRRGILFK